MNPVGYLIKKPDGLHGQRGLYYDYVLASNGLFIEAEGAFLAARIPITVAEVRGLAPAEPKVVLRHGLIPQRFFDLALSAFLSNRYREMYVAITYETGQNKPPSLGKDPDAPGLVGPFADYHIRVPEQAESKESLAAGDQGHGCRTGVSYINPQSVALDLHSHGELAPLFSSQDNRDETGLKLYGVVGDLVRQPTVQIRVGVYGYFMPLIWSDVFKGSLIGVRDFNEIDIIEQVEYV